MVGLEGLERRGVLARDPARRVPGRRLELRLDLIFGLKPADENVELELADNADDNVRADLGIEDLDDPFLGHVVERLAELLGRSEEHTSELQSLMRISFAVFCLKKKK